MNAEEMQQSIVVETRLLRVMVLVDIASSECEQLVDLGYDPEKMTKYQEILSNMSESVALRINHERNQRAEAEKPQPAQESGIIVPFRGHKRSPNGT